MKKAIAASVFVCLMSGPELGSAGEVTPYGFVRFDAVFDDSKLSHPQYPNWVKSEPPGTEDNGTLTIHPRLTRVGARFAPVELDEDSEISGVIEADFQNGGSESRQILRLRKAYFNLKKGDWHFLAGQTWDLISPLFPAANNDGMMWNTGNLGDRHPQARLTYKPGAFSAAVALGQTGAVDKKDLDKNGTLDGWEAAVPFLQARVGIEQMKFKAGAWAHRGSEKTATPVAGNSSDFTSAVCGPGLFGIPCRKAGGRGRGVDRQQSLRHPRRHRSGGQHADRRGDRLLRRLGPCPGQTGRGLEAVPGSDDGHTRRGGGAGRGAHQEPGSLLREPLPALEELPGRGRVSALDNRVQRIGRRDGQQGGSSFHLEFLKLCRRLDTSHSRFPYHAVACRRGSRGNFRPGSRAVPRMKGPIFLMA